MYPSILRHSAISETTKCGNLCSLELAMEFSREAKHNFLKKGWGGETFKICKNQGSNVEVHLENNYHGHKFWV